ncbi:hypothetical protein BDW59DRAFT_177528 [Aspergillus cavernicola]|uniref:P-loop containing nucleoside triphosphate hydrolase protein n=1 Tax=Aspergillus cavernicola TaxID=176166 RepID=A0ABR4HJU7_9EURO
MTYSRACQQFTKSRTCRHKDCRLLYLRSCSTPTQPQSSKKDNNVGAWKRTARTGCTFYIASEILDAFFAGARSLVERNAESMQDVIRYMSEEHGLRYIQQLVERELQLLPSPTRRDVFQSQMAPFLETISHPKVLSSLVAEHSLGIIYNFIYGIGGTRASNLFASICSVLESIPEQDDTRAKWLEVSLAVFSRIMFVNSTAFIHEGLGVQTSRFQDILSAMDKGEMARKLHISRRYLTQLVYRVEMGAQLPTASQSEEAKQNQIITFVPLQEPPGGRHDNDHMDFSLIKILPTHDEILSSRAEYIPERNPIRWHVDGLDGLLDRNFRLLREDSVGELRDVIHHLHKELLGDTPRAEPSRKSQLRTNTYQGARIVKYHLHWSSGFLFRVEFPQPQHLRRMSPLERESWWILSKRLQPGALVCLTINGTRAVFCTVVEAPDERPRNNGRRGGRHQESASDTDLWKSAESAFTTLTPVDSVDNTLRSILEYFDRPSQSFSMVEFPGVLLASFEPTLRALQRMKKASHLPFENLLVPSTMDEKGSPVVPPPLYALSGGFEFNLRCLMNDDSDLFFKPDEPFDIQNLYMNSILDKAQAKALVNSLQHSIGLIQGPPGTGKSFTGIALIKVLLANKLANGGRIGPIVCVAYTNHALDQLLEALLDKEITPNIVRIGSQSKSEQLQGCNLRNVTKHATRTREEKTIQHNLRSELSTCEDKFSTISFRQIPAKTIPPHLRHHYPNHFRQLFCEDGNDSNPAKLRNPGTIIKAWLTSGRASDVGLLFEDLTSVNVHEMSRPEKLRVYQQWMDELAEATRLEAVQLASAHAEAKRDWDRIRSEVDLRCLAEADVIGVTTSGLAKNLEMLQKLQAKVVLCEEAGEVLEAHLLTALLPSVEHAILIGDHLQLRPQVQNYELSRENPNGGDRYSLDVSLFERLVGPTSALGSGLPYITLETQHHTLYPGLKDSDDVSGYPKVSGVKKRLFWLDHRFYEEDTGGDPVTTSRWNNHEIEMTVALVNHLVSQGEYKSGDIAVLTPYLGQLYRLRQRLSQQFAVCVSERDQEQLENADIAVENRPMPAVKSNLLDTLRVASIDNFQGEEAKIVVISLVRSNSQNRCGFLRTSNRINVLLSRAQHGMYIIGNSDTSVHVPMWAQVIQILQEDNNISQSIDLECPRHPDAPISVSDPSHFLQFSPEGGCTLRCIKRLACGHGCEHRCHSDMLHEAALCRQPCPKLRKSCTHPCPDICGMPCPFNCSVIVTRGGRTLKCGHVKESLPCWQDQDHTKFLCPELIRKVVRRCKHEVSAPCHLNVSTTSYKCDTTCGAQLPCGHICKRKCYECKKIDGTDHGNCLQKCARNYSTCTHICESNCHRDTPCLPCQAVCEKCCDPCTPCAEEKCLSVCPHSKCTMPCAAPCNHIPCSRRCDKKLQCGHQCPSVCGEQCPSVKFCQICARKNIKNHPVDFILGQMYRDINLSNDPCIFPKCGHFLTMENMDAQMDLGKYYDLDNEGKPTAIKELAASFRTEDVKKCALCRGHLRDISRYGRLLILYLNREYMPLAQDMARNIQRLQDFEYKQKIPLPAVVRIQGHRSNQIEAMKGALGTVSNARWGDLLNLRERIDVYRRRVSVDEQPFIRVLNMIEAARRRQNLPISKSDCGSSGALQSKGILLATALSIRLDLALTMDFLRMKTRSRVELTIDLQESREECECFIKQARESKRPPLEAEGYLYLAQYHALQRCNCQIIDESKEHLEKGRAALETARAIVDNYPNQTRGLASEIDGAENMLLSTFYLAVTKAERLAVVQAMASEFVGTGHWYYCENGHPFTIGECGGAMQESFCPECGASVGGRQHQVVEGVTRADDLERSGLGFSRGHICGGDR